MPGRLACGIFSGGIWCFDLLAKEPYQPILWFCTWLWKAESGQEGATLLAPAELVLGRFQQCEPSLSTPQPDIMQRSTGLSCACRILGMISGGQGQVGDLGGSEVASVPLSLRLLVVWWGGEGQVGSRQSGLSSLATWLFISWPSSPLSPIKHLPVQKLLFHLF